MKPAFLRLLLLAAVAGLLPSCANITFIGHERAYDLNVAVKADLISPVSTNLGFESKTGVAAPPKESSPFRHLLNRVEAHKEDVVPTVSRLDVTRIKEGEFEGVNYVSVVITGDAAVVATTPNEANAINSAGERITKAETVSSNTFINAATEIAKRK